MSIQPLHDKIAVIKKEQTKQTTSGLLLANSTHDQPSEGTVLAVGTGKILSDGSVQVPVVKVGDEIVFMKNAGQMVKIDGIEILMLTEMDVLGVLK